MNFDRYGLIKPDKKHQLSRAEFKETFVDAFPSSSTRNGIYLDYDKFTSAFAADVTESFTQWIGGSFTTEKEDPNDIDILTILSGSDYKLNQKIIESKFRKIVGDFPLVDSYFLQAPATKTEKAPLFKSDLIYWVHQFSYTRKNRKGKRQTRGYIEIVFNHFSYE